MDGTPQSNPDSAWQPRHNPWIVAVSVMLATFMEVLDTTILNVALPYIAGGMAASNSQATWVLTSYLVSNAIVLPMTDWLGRRFGRRNLLLACIALFTVSSALCGAASNLGNLILFRILQGVGGGGLQPISQAILLESFPPSKRGQAMGLFALGVVVAPILGPVLGGWLTDNVNWRWCFFINLPVGLLAILLSSLFVEDPPYLRNNRPTQVDVWGLFFLTLWLGCLQVLLDKGQEDDWFGAVWLRWMAGLSFAGFVCFVVRELSVPVPLVDLRILKDKSFATGVSLVFLIGVVLYGTLAALPLFLQTLISYTAFQSGIAVSPRGIGAVAGAIFAGRMLGVMSARTLVALGFLLLAASSFLMGNFDIQIAQFNVVVPNLLNGFGAPLVFVPLTTAAVVTLRREQMGNATGLFNLFRNIGGSVGTSLIATYSQRFAQIQQNFLAGYYTPENPNYRDALASIQSYLATQSGTVPGAQQALGVLYRTLTGQASLWAYVDIFQWSGWVCLASLPLAFFLAPTKGAKAPSEGMIH
ncbi:Multidrug export protein EmrB [Methylacidimicrobium cyclopophantes]|uniref:Multidrug export protein EmrB n=1 Tax=Methylacidimicrobium cyclopophantes TaxID=1041766 RepID=A0A5E6MET5_9BACT|nr:DHA2 family efflux MFS transporter permease subunit [Methylacidimicrobium cyclopophantes]VVM04577.1 Multidrug export protein EmrB [Methylacidimicrobium cyclopophantes]